MLYDLEQGFQKRFERHGAYEMFQDMKLVFQSHARVKRLRPLTKYLAYKMEENSSTSEHVLRMSEYYNCLNQVGVNPPDMIVIGRVLYSLSPSYLNFVMNYNMERMTKVNKGIFDIQIIDVYFTSAHKQPLDI